MQEEGKPKGDVGREERGYLGKKGKEREGKGGHRRGVKGMPAGYIHLVRNPGFVPISFCLRLYASHRILSMLTVYGDTAKLRQYGAAAPPPN